MKLFSLILVVLSVTFGQLMALDPLPSTNQFKSDYLDARSVARIVGQAKLDATEPEAIAVYAIQKSANLTSTLSSLKLVATKHSQIGTHHLYQQQFDSRMVYDGFIKVNLAKDGSVLSIIDGTIPDQFLSSFNTHEGNYLVFDGTNCWPVVVNNTEDESGLWQELRYNDQLLYARNLASFNTTATLLDTTVYGYCYIPDPLTSAGVSYGGSYKDENDATNTALDDQRVYDSIPGRYNTTSGEFILENEFVAIAEHNNPSVLPVTSGTSEFLFDRSESGFEDFNALYHITKYKLYLNEIGLTELGDFQIQVDTHAHNGNDQSSFLPSNPPKLRFGEGGVDDAEDADVLVHEYFHSLSYDAAPETNTGAQRQAIDEGLGDYVAASYSLALNSYDWHKVFKWDGHNEFWEGRLAQVNKVYPNDLENDKHKDGEILTSAMMDINQTIGRAVTDVILYNSIYNYYPNMSLPDAAELFLETDSLLNNGANYVNACPIFYDYGLVDFCSVGVVTDIPTDIKIAGINGQVITNSVPIQINSLHNVRASLYSIQGQLLSEHQGHNQPIQIATTGLSDGAYLLNIQDVHGAYTLRLIKQ